MLAAVLAAALLCRPSLGQPVATPDEAIDDPFHAPDVWGIPDPQYRCIRRDANGSCTAWVRFGPLDDWVTCDGGNCYYIVLPFGDALAQLIIPNEDYSGPPVSPPGPGEVPGAGGSAPVPGAGNFPSQIPSGIGGGGSGGSGGGGVSVSSGSSSLGIDFRSFPELYRNGPIQQTEYPVLVSDGIKVEHEVDLVVPLPGQDFVLSRHYTAGNSIGRDDFLWFTGRGWGLSVEGWIVPKPRIAPGTNLPTASFPLPDGADIVTFPLEEASRFLDTDPQNQHNLRPVYEPVGSGFGRIVRGEYANVSSGAPVDWPTLPVWLHEVSGKGQTAFYDTADEPNDSIRALDRRIAERRDAFGNTARYQYVLYQRANTQGLAVPRLSRIMLNGYTPGDSDAWLEFSWTSFGQLESVWAYRCGATNCMAGSPTNRIPIGYVKYTYASQSRAGVRDLVVVERGVPLHLGAEGTTEITPTAPNQESWQRTFYRYWYEAGNEKEGRLTHTWNPQLIEAAAERWNNGSDPDRLVDFVYRQLANSTPATLVGTSGRTVHELASKSVSYYGMETAPGYLEGRLKGMVKEERVREGINLDVWTGRRSVFTYGRKAINDPTIVIDGPGLQYSFRPLRWKTVTKTSEYMCTPNSETLIKAVTSWSEERVMLQAQEVWQPEGPNPATSLKLERSIRAPFVVANKIEEYVNGVAGRTWMTYHDFVGHHRVRTQHPSSIEALLVDPETGTLAYDDPPDPPVPGPQPGPQDAVVGRSGGSVSWWVYDQFGRVVEEWVSKQTGTVAPEPTSPPESDPTAVRLKSITYCGSDAAGVNHDLSSRLDLPCVEREFSGTNPASFQETTHSYGVGVVQGLFRPAMAFHRVAIPLESTAQNGSDSAGTSTTLTIFAPSGDPSWDIDAEGNATHTLYSERTGAMTSTVRNADTTLPGQPWPAGAGVPPPPHLADGQLTTTRINDWYGRPLQITGEDGTTKYIRYTRATIPDAFPGASGEGESRLKYFTLLNYSPIIGTQLCAGPLSVQWATAEMNLIRASTYRQTAAPALGVPPDVEQLLEDAPEYSRVMHTYHIGGALTETRTWHQLQATLPGQSFDSTPYVEQFEYDGFGRVTRQLSAVGEDTRTEYDAQDRVIKVSSGRAGLSILPREETFYDFDFSTSEPHQGVGDGLATVTRKWVGTGALAATTVRDTVTVYDWLKRPRFTFARDFDSGNWTTAAPGAHTASILDLMGRPIETITIGAGNHAGLIAALQADAPDPFAQIGGATLVQGRGWTHYSARGLVYRTESAIDPLNPGAGKLRTDSFFDALGRELAVVGPSGAVSQKVYDGLGRVAQEVVTDGSALRSGGGFAAAATPGGAGKVLTRTTTRFIPAADSDWAKGLPYMSVLEQRRHDDTSGAGQLDNPVRTYAATVYDRGSRPAVAIDYGTNLTSPDSAGYFAPGGSEPAAATVIGYTSGFTFADSVNPPLDARTTLTFYDEIGRVFATRDPVNFYTRQIVDALGRTIGSFEGASLPGVWSMSLQSGGDVGTAWTVSGVGSSDRATTMLYDAAGNVIRRIAHLGESGSSLRQITEYVYDPTDLSLSGVSNANTSYGLLYEIRYPQPDYNSGVAWPSTDDGDIVRFGYNLAGEQVATLDQCGTIRDFFRDPWGRLLHDSVRVPGSAALDVSVKRLSTTFDALGRVVTTGSYTGASPGSGTLLNETHQEYDQLGRVVTYSQNPVGTASPTGGTPEAIRSAALRIDYLYEDVGWTGGLGGNTSRLGALSYPTLVAPPTGPPPSTLVTYAYGDAGTISDAISRVEGMSWDAGALHDSVTHEYMGAARRVRSSFSSVNQTITRDRTSTGVALGQGEPTGSVTGLDRFGRVKRHLWYRGTPLNRLPVPALADLGYTYRKDSLITARIDKRPGMSAPDIGNPESESYWHDSLKRLTTVRRGVADPLLSPPQLATRESQDFKPDRLNNITDQTVLAQNPQSLADHLVVRTRTSLNATNEIAGIGEISQPGPSDPATPNIGWTAEYDAAGRLTRQQVSASSWRRYKYDAWGRLTRVAFEITGQSDPQVRCAFTYYAGHQLATRVADTVPNAVARAEHRTHRYYDTQWQLLEERIDAAYRLEPDGDEYSGGEELGGPWDWTEAGFGSAFGHSRTVARQYIWDPTGGVDELVQVRAAPVPTAPVTLGATGFTQGFWALTDKSHSAIGYLSTAGGGIAERVQYRAYGTPILAATGDADGNGTVTFADQTAVLAGFNGVVGNPAPGGVYTTRADLNQDGQVVFNDINVVFSNFGKAQRYDRVSERGMDVSANGVPWGEEGFQPALGSGSVIGYAGSVWDPEAQLCLMRNRWHDPNLARWLTRDPAGYVDGMSLYVYVRGNPLVYYDPFGMWSWYQGWGTTLSYAFGGNPEGVSGESVLKGAGKGAITGGKAVANAAVDTAVSTATLGQVDCPDVCTVTQEDLENGYNASYGFARAGTETIAGVVTGGMSGGSRVGAALNAMDKASNLLSAGEGAVDMVQNGISVENGLQVVGGVLGASGNLGRSGKSAGGAADAMQDAAPSLQQQLRSAATDASETIGPGRGAVHGTHVHSEFERRVNGLGRDDLSTEVSYMNGKVVARGTKGSVRVDVVHGPLDNPTGIYDLKTGNARLTNRRLEQLKRHLPAGAPGAVELRP